MTQNAMQAVTIISPPDPYFSMDSKAYESLISRATPDSQRAYQEHRSAMQRRVPPTDNESPGYDVIDGIAVIPFHGMVEKRESFWGWLWGSCASTEGLIQALQTACADSNVREWLIDIDSPGGSISGVWDAAQAVFAARALKPGTAWGGDLICSAAYWIGCMAPRLLVNATCFSGSIGVYTTHNDYTRMLRNFGIESRRVASGPHKGAGAMGVPLTEAQEAEMQATVDELATEFVAGVAKGRGLTPERAKLAADGRAFLPREAIKLGLVDGVTTLSDLLGQLRAAAPVIPDPAYVEPSDPPGECGDEDDCKKASTPKPSNTDRADSAARDGAPAATTAAPKETDMNEDEVRALISGAVAPLQGENAALKAELAALKAQSDTTAKDVTATKAEQGLNKLLADARGENGGPVKLAAKDEVTAGYLRTVYETKGAEAAVTLLGTLPVIGNGKRTAAQQAEAMGTTDRGARHPLNFVGAAPHAYVQGRLGTHERAMAQLEKMGESKTPVVSRYRNAVLEATRRAPTMEVPIENA